MAVIMENLGIAKKKSNSGFECLEGNISTNQQKTCTGLWDIDDQKNWLFLVTQHKNLKKKVFFTFTGIFSKLPVSFMKRKVESLIKKKVFFTFDPP